MLLYAVLTHRSPADVLTHLNALEGALPGRRLAIAYGGSPEHYAALPGDIPKVFLEEPTLRQPPGQQSYVSVLVNLYDAFVRDAPEVTHLHVIEFDHIVVDERYEPELEDALRRSRADYLGVNCVDQTATNWVHGLGFPFDDYELQRLLMDVSDDDDPSAVRIFGGVANGFVIGRDALEAFVTFERHLTRYAELYVPTLLHHLGFRVRDAVRVSRVFDHVRWAPVYSESEIRALRRGSVLAVHPVKDYALLPLVRELAAPKVR